MPFDYLIEGVSAEEYEALNSRKEEIIGNTMKSFNDIWQKRVSSVKISFAYNRKEGAVGITLNRNDADVLALERIELSEEEDAVVASMYSDLQKELRIMRVKKGSWT